MPAASLATLQTTPEIGGFLAGFEPDLLSA
jgi:hypothetical protein